MEIIVNVLAPVMFFISALMGGGDVQSAANTSVELGLSETSPLGEAGGFATPASGCSDSDSRWHGRPVHDCDIMPDISTNKPIVRLGDEVVVFWDPMVHAGCELSANVMALRTSPNPTTAPNPNQAGSRIDVPTGETTYTIVCDGENYQDSAVIKVLPRIQET